MFGPIKNLAIKKKSTYFLVDTLTEGEFVPGTTHFFFKIIIYKTCFEHLDA